MSWNIAGRTMEKVGVIGSGQIGPDIALHFSKVLTPHRIPVVVVDIAPAALEAGKTKVARKIEKGVASGAFKQDQGDAMLANITFSPDYKALEGASLVVEAATEDVEIKKKIFASLEALVPESAILTSNSSHLEPERVFSHLKRPGRCLVTHYFFPAERNPALEVVPAADTEPDVVEFAMAFYEQIGKVPVRVKSRYGFAVDPIFEGLFLAALLIADEGIGTVKEIDTVARTALGQGVGPFTAMNLAGGNPITYKGMLEYNHRIHSWFHSPESLERAAKQNETWPVAGRGETVVVTSEKEAAIGDLMLGAYFGLACEILDSGIIEPEDLEMAVELALVMTPPLKLMNRTGVARALDLVKKYHAKYPAFPVSRTLAAQAAAGQPFPIPAVIRKDIQGVSVLTLRRPRVLNALSGEVFRQLGAHLDAIKGDRSIEAVVLTGHGSKAFAAGADIKELASLATGKDAEAASRRDQAVANRLEDLGKPVVCALNGLALGGGAEVAQACTARIARKGLPIAFGQPEVNLGIIPGCGGTQRLARIVGVREAWTILRNGKPVSGARAKELGFLFAEVDGDLVTAAITLARDIARGKTRVPVMTQHPVEVPGDLPEVDIGPLSRQVDGFVVRAFREGLRLPLREGLELEARLFGEVFDTEDCRIGIQSFLEKGPKVPAPFKHRG